MTSRTSVQSLAERLARLERENEELQALHSACLALQGELSLEAVLQNIVDQATHLLESRYGALALTDADGRIQQFITSGVTEEERQRIGTPPKGVGLLGVTLREGQALRLSEIGADLRSAGFPDNHPPMRSLLAVPVPCHSPYRSNLYLAEKRGRSSFSEADQTTLQNFALGAAVAIDTAHLHQRSESLAIAEERLRISREIHDGLAQVLAYVNTKAQAAREHLSRARYDHAAAQLDELAAAAREVYSETREGILALRIQPSPDCSLAEALRDYAEHWQARGVTTVTVETGADLDLPSGVELQVMRIVQEALTNVRKHSRAHTARIAVAREDGRLRVTIEDDGRGFDPATLDKGRKRRFGLAVMRERAEGLGGRFDLVTAPGAGTRIEVTLPDTASTALETGEPSYANPDS